MKLFTNKKLIQKITIVMVFLMLFNFITPNYVKAVGLEDVGEFLVTGVEYLVLSLADGAVSLMQKIFIGTDAIWTKEDQIKAAGLMTTGGVILDNLTSKDKIESWITSIFGAVGIGINAGYKVVDTIIDVQENKEKIANYEDIYEIAISPEKIFSGTINALNIDFFSSSDTTTEGDTNIEWLNSYKDALNSLQARANELNEKGNLTSDEELELEAILYVWMMAGGKLSDDEIIYKVKTWYGGMDNSYSDAKFKKYWFTDIWYANEENKEYGDKILQIVDEYGISQVVSSVGSDPNGFSSAISWAANKENSPASVLHDIIATWYKIMRNIALIVMLIILVYVGIRIMLSSTASDNTKYKKMLIDWVVAICILFVLHYIMIFTVNITQVITNAFTTISNPTVPDDIMNSVRQSASEMTPAKFGYVILYLVLIIYTIYFLWYYVKRVVYAAFLTLIAPLVAITYPLDKMGDSKSQAFNMWLREYILNIVIQPVHLIIYTVMVTSALDLAVNNPIYAVVVIGAMIPAENFIKEMFGLNTQKGPKGGLAAAALTMSALNKLAHRPPPKFGHNEGGSQGGSAGKEEKIERPRMEDKFSELSNSWTDNNEDTDDKENPLDLKDNTEDDNNYINDGDFETSRNNNQINGDNENDAIKDNALKGLLGNKEDVENPTDQNEEPNNNALEELKKPERKNAIEPSNINNSRVGLINSKNTKPNLNKDKKKIQKQQLKYRKRAARKAVNKHYRGRDIKMLKKMGKGALRATLGAVGAGTAATIGLAAGIATGDISKAVQYTTAGALAGSQIGKNVGNGIVNLAGGASDFVKGEIEANKMYKNELYKNDKEYQKQQYAIQNRKISRSSDTKTAIRAHFGYELKDTKEMNSAMEFVETARNKGMENLDKILNAYGLTQGIDSEGNSIGTELSQDQALLAGLMAEKYDVDNESGRKSAKSSLKLQLADNIYNNSNGEITKAESVTLGKEKAIEVMKYVDIAQGINAKDAGKTDAQEALQDAKDDAKRAKEYKEQAEIQAKIKAKAEAEAKAEVEKKAKLEAKSKAEAETKEKKDNE